MDILDNSDIVLFVVARHCIAYSKQGTHNPNEISLSEAIQSELKELYNIKANKRDISTWISIYAMVKAMLQRLNVRIDRC